MCINFIKDFFFWGGGSVSLVLVFLSLEKTLTCYKFYYLFVLSFVFFIAIEGKVM